MSTTAVTCYLIGCDAVTAPEELRPRLLQKKLVIIVICHRHSDCRILQPSGRRSACGGNRKRFDREELFVTGIFPCQEEHGRRRISSKLLLGFLQLLSRQTDECCWMSKGGVQATAAAAAFFFFFEHVDEDGGFRKLMGIGERNACEFCAMLWDPSGEANCQLLLFLLLLFGSCSLL